MPINPIIEKGIFSNALFENIHSEGLNSPPDERKEGETMYVTYADLMDTR